MNIRSSVLGVFIAVVSVTTWAQQDFSKVEITTTKIADGIYMLEGAGGNIGVSVGVDGVFLVDDQFAPLTEKIVAAVKAVDDGPIRFVLNTHWHGDHTGGNENLGEAGALIVAVAILAFIAIWQFWYMKHVARKQSRQNEMHVPSQIEEPRVGSAAE